jgi:NAD(P)-dependent dehydrogenase (short-subunit alcohol dehydrogenase family)
LTVSLRLDGKVAVITGGASGLGRASTFRFLEDGASVVVADMNEKSGAAIMKLADESGYRGRTQFIRTDVSQESDVTAAVDLAVSAFGRLDCMFNNAGIPGALGPLSDIKVEEWDFTFAVLLRGPLLGIQQASRIFKAQGRGGVILNTASLAGLTGGSGPKAYSVAKAAVIHLTTVAALELAPFRVRVNAICPGAIITAIGGDDEQKARERMVNAQPWPDIGKPEDIAAAASFLASDDARFITGQSLVVDGGALASGVGMEQRLGRGSSWSSISGIHYGTTGQRGELRRLNADPTPK